MSGKRRGGFEEKAVQFALTIKIDKDTRTYDTLCNGNNNNKKGE